MKKLIIVLGILALLLTGTHLFVTTMVKQEFTQRQMSFLDATPLETLKSLQNNRSDNDPNFADIEEVTPFREAHPFDEDAHTWTTFYSQYGAAGALIFDANGDGLNDVYLCQDGQNWTRDTDENGVLKDEPRYQSNGLYLNQGNDENGDPILVQVDELVAKSGEENAAAELLVEDYLFPRQSVTDSEKRWGRSSNVAVAADFNNDGRPDLLVGNEPKGMLWSDEKTQRVLMQFVSPSGRQAKQSRLPLASLGTHFIDYEPRYGVHDERESSRGKEFEGANSLYLNMGDTDGDGIPEWKDASDVGISGSRATVSLSIADIDLDGDLDIFEGNTCDWDYWVGGSKYLAGNANRMYINQLAETGKLSFIERSQEMDVDGLYDEENPVPDYHRLKKYPFLPEEYSILIRNFESYKPEYLTINGVQSEPGQLTWATVFQDVNDDGYPDLWVANDLGFLRLHINEKGKKFVKSEHARSENSGIWMSFAPSDFNGDLKEDLLAGNGGGGIMNHAFVLPNPYELFEPIMMNATAIGQFFLAEHDTRHALIDGNNFGQELPNKVRHSKVLPPDISFPNNYRRHAPKGHKLPPFDPDTINAYEFAWGMMPFDIQNDGRMDLYYLGCLFGRGGGLFPITGTGPGRLLVNASKGPGALRFEDLTAEHQVFNINELQYDKLESDGYIYRRAPSQNWRKRDVVNSYDRSSWISQGRAIQEKVTNQDLIQTAENGRAVVTADLNNDGFEDLLIRNMGGYDSRQSDAVYLKAMIDGRAQVLPPPDHNYPALTNFEPGPTRLFINTYQKNHWVKIQLVDDAPDSFNRDAIGAKVVANQSMMRIMRSGEGSFLSNKLGPVHFGLGQDSLNHLKIHWPDAKRTVTELKLDGITNQVITISKTKGILASEDRS